MDTNIKTHGQAVHGSSLRRGVLIGTYLVAGVLGYFLGVRGILPPAKSPDLSGTTPLARVGFALQQENVAASPRDWAQLRDDVEAVRAALKTVEPDAFELVVAVRGLNNGGNAAWDRAEQLCRGLKWPRCDRRALEDLRSRARP
ncbi:MAG TPA: hypothetical protein VGP07_11035 [Polyangia bacterium]|jgi:hypothetical protein